jgi:hypothetical protein
MAGHEGWPHPACLSLTDPTRARLESFGRIRIMKGILLQDWSHWPDTCIHSPPNFEAPHFGSHFPEPLQRGIAIASTCVIVPHALSDSPISTVDKRPLSTYYPTSNSPEDPFVETRN